MCICVEKIQGVNGNVIKCNCGREESEEKENGEKKSVVPYLPLPRDNLQLRFTPSQIQRQSNSISNTALATKNKHFRQAFPCFFFASSSLFPFHRHRQ
jgi:hypothetical protein